MHSPENPFHLVPSLSGVYLMYSVLVSLHVPTPSTFVHSFGPNKEASLLPPFWSNLIMKAK